MLVAGIAASSQAEVVLRDDLRIGHGAFFPTRSSNLSRMRRLQILGSLGMKVHSFPRLYNAVGVKSFMPPLKWLHPHLRVIWVSGARIVNAQNWHCFHLERSEE